jgi:hypothetical protein
VAGKGDGGEEGDEELPSMTKLEQTMSDLRVKEGEEKAAAAEEEARQQQAHEDDDDASIPSVPPM